MTIKLNRLQKLAESSGKTPEQKLTKAVYGLSDSADDLEEKVEKIALSLESDVLTDQFKALGFPATESKAAKAAARSALIAIQKLANELQDLHMAVASNSYVDED